jgi:TRAP-type C4-dicarboxylate transport system permease small subunit
MSENPPPFDGTRFRAGLSVGWLTVPLDVFAGLVLSAMVLLNCIDVIGRDLFNSPVTGTTELTRLMIPFIVFAALPIVSYREEHISVDLVDLVYPAKGINPRQFMLNLITMILMAGVTYQLYLGALDAEEFTDMTEDLRIGLWNVYYFISAMAAITTLLLALNLVRYVRKHGPMSPDRRDGDQPNVGFGA